MSKPTFDEWWDELRKKGGRIHAGLESGFIVQVNGEKPKVLVEPIDKEIREALRRGE